MKFITTSLFATGLLALLLAAPLEATRGRVQVVQNGAWDYQTDSYDPDAPGRTVVTDQGTLLRGADFWALTDHGWATKHALKFENWKRLKDLGFNLVRLSLNNMDPETHNDPVYYTREEWLEQIDVWVDWADELGMYVMLDHHEVGGHTIDTLREFWSDAAPRYRHRTHVIYEIANEPVAWRPNNYTEQDMAHQQELYDLIRSLAPKTHIVLLSFAIPELGMKELAEELDVDWSNASVGFHGYWMRDGKAIDELKRAFPVFNTEFSSPVGSATGSKDPYFIDGYAWQQELMEKWQISWVIWDVTHTPAALDNIMPQFLAHIEENGYMWELDDYEADAMHTELRDWIYMNRSGYLFAPEYGWMYPLENTGWTWLYNFADDTWRQAE